MVVITNGMSQKQNSLKTFHLCYIDYMENEIKQPHKYGKITRPMSFQDWNRLNFWLIDEFPEKKVTYDKEDAKKLVESMKRNIKLPAGSLDNLVKKLDKKTKKKEIPEEKINKKLDKTITKILRRKAKENKRSERKEKKKNREQARFFSEHHYRTNETGSYWRNSEYFRESLNDRSSWESEFMQNF